MTVEEVLTAYRALSPLEKAIFHAGVDGAPGHAPDIPFWWPAELQQPFKRMIDHLYFYTGDEPGLFREGLTQRCRKVLNTALHMD